VPDKDGNDERNNDNRSHVERAEHALLSAVRAATTVNDAIHEMAAAVPKAGPTFPRMRPAVAADAAGGIARLMMASNAASARR